MNSIILKIKKLDFLLIASSAGLSVLGLLSIYSSSIQSQDFSFFYRQTIFAGAGFFLMLALSFFDWRALRENSYLILALYGVGILALLGLFFFAPTIRGVKAWYRLGNLSVDPVEFIKIVLIVLLAKYFSMRHVEMYRLRHIFLSGIYALVPAVLISRQPNLGSSLIIVALWVGVLIISGIKLRHFILLAFLGIVLAAAGWSLFLEDYQKTRIVSFLAPGIDPEGASWSQNQSKIAIGAGGLFGQGMGKGSQTQYGFLSEPHTDFIFAAIAEEFGLAGILILFLLFAVLFYRIIRVASAADSNFPRLFCFGAAIVLLAELVIHIGMNLGMLPVIGISLPLVSYGGSGLIAAFASLGLILSIKAN